MSTVRLGLDSGAIVSARDTIDFFRNSDSSNKTHSLGDLNGEQAILNLPVISVLMLLAILGTAGNTCVVYVYRTRFRKNSGSYFIMALAILDLLNSALCLPWEIYTLSNPYKNDLPVLCKLARFLVTFVYLSAALILVCVAFSRYFKISHPLHCYSSGRAQFLTFVMIALAMSVAWPQIPLSGTRTIATRVTDLYGHNCATSDKLSDSLYPVLFYASLYILLSLCFLLMLLFYGRLILIVVRGSGQGRLGRQIANRDYTPRSSTSIASERSFGSSQNLSHATSNQRRSSRFSILAQVGRTTRMLVLVTCVFLLGYLPFITVNVLAFFNGDNDVVYPSSNELTPKHSGGETVDNRIDNGERASDILHHQSISFSQGRLSALSSSITSSVNSVFAPKTLQQKLPAPPTLSYGQRLAFEICSRSYYFSSAANPLIYSVLNVRFRQESMVALRHVIMRLPHWLRQRFKGHHGVT
ncbi:orexin receptor type 2 [Plakobranchus ocellatus]|uniref:Orexin receptor type 2 n=1 Tax=Plakobranchus ocellatus TaxID=259542 RepID=A0AAV3XWH5_9GAST|nr:orexin receptor type 2 [Plakobranchus ocellatus]